MSTINDLIYTNAHNAYEQGYDAGVRDTTRDIFDEVNAVLSNLSDYYYEHGRNRDAIWEAQARVEALQERIAAQLESK